MGNPSSPGPNQNIADIANQITQMLLGLRFGSIEITVHDSKVVQIERREKIRPESPKT